MSDKTFKKIDLSKEELIKLWDEENKKRLELEDRVRQLEKSDRYWRGEAEKLERILNSKL